MPYEPLKPPTAAQIFYSTYPKPPSPVEGILPAGLTVLSGDSKIGKSWLVLWLALQISQGLPVWGIPTEKQDVIYLAIEDNDQRLQKRMHRLVDVPPPNLYISYSSGCIGEELEELFEATKDHPFSLLIQMAAFYGLKRSEVLGLKWDAVDFERETLTIEHTVTEAKVRGKRELIKADSTKTKSSLRSLPLVAGFKEKLMERRRQQQENMRICRDCYNQEHRNYVFVDPMGNLYTPQTVSSNFAAILKQNGLRKIRFHDLRHSCASLLLANDVPMKQIQEWLGHSDISTTANIYSHLDFKSKITSANVMDGVLDLPEGNAPGWVLKTPEK